MGRLVTMIAALVIALMPVAPAVAEDADLVWQDVITAQVQAFRDHDAAAAFSYAATTFHQSFVSPEDFFLVIISSGYSPIMDSKSHSFGEYQMVQEGVVHQLVTFVGTDQKLYQAIYELELEADGWRVTAVQLVQAQGVAV